MAPPCTIKFFPSQLGGNTESPRWTGDPRQLFWSDARSILNKFRYVFGVIPFRVGTSDPFDELYPSAVNIKSITIHIILITIQSLFLLSLPLCILWPVPVPFPFLLLAAYIGAFWLVNSALCRILNGSSIRLHSKDLGHKNSKCESETWIFVNGVSVGRDWLQSNIDRLSLTFGRPITGVHNPTYGIIFDLIQCLIQRSFCYATQDVRDAYVLIKQALQGEKCKKVVLILHSQGGIEGGLVIDWLLAELPHDVMHRLEVYTFGNAANHFNNPHRTGETYQAARRREHSNPDSKAIRYIEHYANSGDFVSQFGVLNYVSQPNAFMGRVFECPNSGHLLNQHYLHGLFPLDKDHQRALPTSDYMEMDVDLSSNGEEQVAREEVDTHVMDINSPISPALSRASTFSNLDNRVQSAGKVKHYSRLWLYLNGASPHDT